MIGRLYWIIREIGGGYKPGDVVLVKPGAWKWEIKLASPSNGSIRPVLPEEMKALPSEISNIIRRDHPDFALDESGKVTIPEARLSDVSPRISGLYGLMRELLRELESSAAQQVDATQSAGNDLRKQQILSKFDRAVIRVKEDNPHLEVRGLLIRIDKINEGKNKNRIPWPKPWFGLGNHRLLSELFDDPEYQGRMKTYISKLLKNSA